MEINEESLDLVIVFLARKKTTCPGNLGLKEFNCVGADASLEACRKCWEYAISSKPL